MSPILDDYLTRTELAAELGICERTLCRWRDLGQGPAITTIGKRPLYRRAAVAAWLAAREGAPS
jgi:hypothetical protein